MASDPEGAALTYSATGLPPVLSLNTATGVIAGTLTFASAGSYTVTATVSDGALTNSKTFPWTVSNVNRAPTLTQPANQTSAENAILSLPLVASDPDGTALTYSATGLPASLSVNATTGVIAGTLTSTSAGTYTVTATALRRLADQQQDVHLDRHGRGPGAEHHDLAPTSGPVGTSVTITGANFGATTGSSTVTLQRHARDADDLVGHEHRRAGARGRDDGERRRHRRGRRQQRRRLHGRRAPAQSDYVDPAYRPQHRRDVDAAGVPRE